MNSARWRAIPLLSCVILALAVTPALAKKKLKKPVKLGPVVTVSATGGNTTTDGQESTATATCPTGKQAVGGGFSAPLIEEGALIVHSSYRSAPGAWTVEAQNAAGSGAVTAHAYCRNASAGPVTDAATATALSTSGETKTVTSTCPPGTGLIAGGFQSTVPPSADAVVFPQVSLASSPTAWTVTGVENQDGAITLTAHAYCLAKIAPPGLVLGTALGSGAEFASASATTAGSCPVPPKPKKGKRKRKKKPAKLLSAGGFSVSPVNGASGAPIPVFGESRVSSPGWLASAVNGSSTTGQFSVVSQGLCV